MSHRESLHASMLWLGFAPSSHPWDITPPWICLGKSMIVLLLCRYTQEERKLCVKFANSSYTLCGKSLVTKTDSDVPLIKFTVMWWRQCKREMGKCRIERLGDGNWSSPPDPALHSGCGHFSPGYGRGFALHRAAQWMDIYNLYQASLLGLCSEPTMEVVRLRSWEADFFLILNFLDKSCHVWWFLLNWGKTWILNQ